MKNRLKYINENVGTQNRGTEASKYAHITADRALRILGRREVVVSMHIAEPPSYTTELINRIFDSKEQLSYARFYRWQSDLRNNFHMRFQADDPDSLVSLLNKSRSPHILKFQKEQPYLYKQLTDFFSVGSSKKNIGDIRFWPDHIKKITYKAYTTMLAYPEVTSNRMLFE